MQDIPDAIVVGAGVNGIALSILLAEAGLSVLVVERSGRIGGMAGTEEAVLPGYWHNPHANFLSFGDVSPFFRNYDLSAYGLNMIVPHAQHGICFADGRPPIILYDDASLEKSVQTIAQYSVRDSEVFRILKKGAGAHSRLIASGMFQPARREWFHQQREAATSISRSLSYGALLGTRSATAFIEAIFESDEMRALMLQAAAEFGVPLTDPGGDLGFMMLIPWLIGQWRLPINGMQSFPNAMADIARSLGVVFLLEAEVRQIIVQNGRARGVRVEGRGNIRCRQLVASSAGVAETILGLAGRRNFSEATRVGVEAFSRHPANALATMMFCLKQAPEYRSAKWNGDIDKCFHTLVGFDSFQDAKEALVFGNSRALPEPASAIRVNTLWDQTQAPPGRHAASADVMLPDPSTLSEDQLRLLQESFLQQFCETWARYAPNLRGDTLVSKRLFFEPYERKMLFRLGTDGYRTEVGRLYLCGAATYPGGGAHGACGANAFEAIAEDLELRPVGRRA